MAGLSNNFHRAVTQNAIRLPMPMLQANCVSLWVVFGGGTHLTVTGQPPSPPTVHLFPPSKEEIQSKHKATLPCLVDGFMPSAIQVSWLVDGSPISRGVETTKPTKHNDKYMASSYLTLDASDWESHESYTCKVTHEGSDYRKTVNRSQCYCVSLWVVFGGGTQLTVTGQPAVPPTVLLFPPSPEEKSTKNKATLVCLMSGFNPSVVQVTWTADGNTITEGVETAKPTKQNDKYISSSYLTMSASDWKSHEVYTCKVTHQGQIIEKSVKSSECS
ncbi:immunoglobulin lambda-1 light chain-like [Eublepharis macularius]|uniref:immunoglobulin lambda-1 light chain-like n=1 Tax=Eublepharis macularius TaxID=481883 RepID=UPI00240F67FA|nr:immunoglobulin lambda-1 light chain-like [Eublepharis macularius]